ncbi:hypothetical protein FE848_10645 [Marinobacter sp. 1-3A]|nr:hypothetical protein [Marinobacter sp. 1-3A]
MTDESIVIAAYIGFASLFLGLIPLPIIVTIGFRYAALIEDRVATDSGGIEAARMFWQGRMIGRFFRSSRPCKTKKLKQSNELA